jgi:hypothetical protein
MTIFRFTLDSGQNLTDLFDLCVFGSRPGAETDDDSIIADLRGLQKTKGLPVIDGPARISRLLTIDLL